MTKLQNDCFILQPRQLCSADCSVDIAFTSMLGNMLNWLGNLNWGEMLACATIVCKSKKNSTA